MRDQSEVFSISAGGQPPLRNLLIRWDYCIFRLILSQIDLWDIFPLPSRRLGLTQQHFFRRVQDRGLFHPASRASNSFWPPEFYLSRSQMRDSLAPMGMENISFMPARRIAHFVTAKRISLLPKNSANFSSDEVPNLGGRCFHEVRRLCRADIQLNPGHRT